MMQNKVETALLQKIEERKRYQWVIYFMFVYLCLVLVRVDESVK